MRGPLAPWQYASLAFGRRLHEGRLVASMGTLGDALDSAVDERFLTTWSASCQTATLANLELSGSGLVDTLGLTELRGGLGVAHHQDGGPAAMNSQAGPVTTAADANPASPS